MAKIEELQNRAFQLERLSDEGKPLCEEIARNSEEILYQAEEESPEPLNGSGRPETGLELDIEGVENQPERITRRQFLLGCNTVLENWHTAILGAQINILDIEKTLASERGNAAMGAKMEYFRNPDGSYTFKAKEKEGIGFKPPKKSVKDAGVWQEAQNERTRKQTQPNRPDA